MSNAFPAHLRRRPALHALVALAGVAMLATAGCSDEQRRDLGGEDASTVLGEHVEAAVEAQSLELDGDLSCQADIADDSALTASCEGTSTSGVAVSGTFDGTADIDAETCSAHLVVQIDGQPVTDEPDVDCFTAPS